MKKRTMILVLALAAMMAAMSPAASANGVSKTALADKGWSCFDNSGEGGAGWHCSPTSIDDFIAGGEGVLNLMVFSAGDETFLGTEILRFDAKDIEHKPCGVDTEWHNLFGDLYACHHWKAGTAPGA
jgi:hypothetical protein